MEGQGRKEKSRETSIMEKPDMKRKEERQINLKATQKNPETLNNGGQK